MLETGSLDWTGMKQDCRTVYGQPGNEIKTNDECFCDVVPSGAEQVILMWGLETLSPLTLRDIAKRLLGDPLEYQAFQLQ